MRSPFCKLFLLPFFASMVHSAVSETYQLDSHFAGATFLDNFAFFTGPDPTNGFVNYVNASYASTSGLTRQLADGSTYIGVDYENVLIPYGTGRDSVRISSTKSWGVGTLVVVDLAHVPGGQCGTWPAMWMLGPNWPYDGEVDIIEGVNSNTNNLMSLHTSPDCTVNSGSLQLGTQETTICDTSVNENSGCGVVSSDPRSYGTNFNTATSGIYATLLLPSSITIWFFPSSSLPLSLSDPTTFGIPQANFSGCDIASHYRNLSLVFDITFCGDWAGAVWPFDGVCAPLDERGCTDFVAKNPAEFEESYWAVRGVDVYTLGVAATSSPKGTSSSRQSLVVSTSSSQSVFTGTSSSASKSITSTSASQSITFSSSLTSGSQSFKSSSSSSSFSSFGASSSSSTAIVSSSSSKSAPSTSKSTSIPTTHSSTSTKSTTSNSPASMSKSTSISHSTSISTPSTSKQSSSSIKKSSSTAKSASTSLLKSSSSSSKKSSSTLRSGSTTSLKSSSSSLKVSSLSSSKYSLHRSSQTSSSSSERATKTSSKHSSSSTHTSSMSSKTTPSSSTTKSKTSSTPSVLARRSTYAEPLSSSQHTGTSSNTVSSTSTKKTSSSSEISSSSHTTPTSPHISQSTSTTPPLTAPSSPSNILTFQFLGCISSLSFPSPSTNSSSPNMTLTVCVESCQLFALAGVYDETCFCSNSFPTIIPDSEQEGVCDLPCPGDGSQVCGGAGSVGVGGVEEREVGEEGVSLSVYRNLIPVMGVGAGGMGGGNGNENGNDNPVVVSFQGAGTRVERRWGIGCLVWLGIVVVAL